EALGALAQSVERLALRINGALGIAFAELAAGVTHGAVGIIQPVAAVTLIAIALLGALSVVALLALLTLLAFLALLPVLALPHAALGELILQFLEPVAQSLLVLREIVHALVLVALLVAAHVVAAGILALLEGLVAQLLLL